MFGSDLLSFAACNTPLTLILFPVCLQLYYQNKAIIKGWKNNPKKLNEQQPGELHKVKSPCSRLRENCILGQQQHRTGPLCFIRLYTELLFRSQSPHHTEFVGL